MGRSIRRRVVREVRHLCTTAEANQWDAATLIAALRAMSDRESGAPAGNANRRKNPPIVAGQQYHALVAVSEDTASHKHPSKRWWFTRCAACGHEGRAQAVWLHRVARPNYGPGNGCGQCATVAQIAALNAGLTHDDRKRISRAGLAVRRQKKRAAESAE